MALKDLKLLTRDKIGVFFMLGFPIIMGVFFGNVMGNVGNTKDAKLEIAVIDEDNSAMSKKLVESLSKNEMLQIEKLERKPAQDRVRRGNLLAMIAVPEGFGETAGIMWADPPALEIGVDPSRSAESAMLEGMIMRSMGELISERFSDPDGMKSFIDDAKEQIAADETMSPVRKALLQTMMGSVDTMFGSLADFQGNDEGGDSGIPGMQIANVKRVDVTREYEPGSTADTVSKLRSKWDISFPQSMVWGVLGCVAGFATLTVRERTLGTLTRLQVAPVARWQILAGKGLGCFIAVLSVIIILMVVGSLLGMRPTSWPMLILAAVCTAFCFTGIMMLLSLIGKTEQATGGAAWGVLTVMAMFGGGMIPYAFMPGFMKKMSNFDPVKWAVQGVEGGVWRGYSFAEMLLPCGVLVAVGAVSLGLGSFVISRQTS